MWDCGLKMYQSFLFCTKMTEWYTKLHQDTFVLKNAL